MGAKRRAYTLIEMVVVTAIIALLATLITPNLVAIKRTQDLRTAQADLLRLPEIARTEAVRSRMPVALRVEGEDVVVERLPDEVEETAAAGAAESGADGDTAEVKRVTLADGVTAEGGRDGQEATDLASFRWVVQPDGTATESALTFRIGGAEQTLILPASGATPARWVQGEAPEAGQDRWQAGELEQRSATTATTATTTATGTP